MHGLGNDFVVIDGRGTGISVSPELARALGDRQRGVGFDQLIVLTASDGADLRMDIWNADGSSALACGNASRCVVALTGARSIDTEGGIIEGEAIGAEVEVAMGEPRFDWNQIPLADAMYTRPLPRAWAELSSPDAVIVGNPHLCFFVEDSDFIPLETLGSRIEHDPAFPERINVNVASVEADGSLKLRTWERGAGLTLACGTGACAAGVSAIRRRLATSPVTVRTRGGDLTIAWAPGEPVRMRGAAAHVFTGSIDLDALSA
jgi:diaminopimelate epimerase